MRRRVLAAFVLVLGGTSPFAQGEPDSEVRFHLFAEELDLADLMDFWVHRKDINLQYEKGALDGGVTLRTTSGVGEETLWAVTNRELVAQGLACIQVVGEENLSIVPLEKAQTLARVEARPEAAEAGYIRYFLQLRHLESEVAVPVAQALLSDTGGTVSELRDSSQLLLAGLKPQVLQAISILRLLDSRVDPPVVVEIALEHASPVTLQTALERATAARSKVAGELRGTVVPLPESASVLLVAPPDEVAEWQSLIRRFDRAQPAVTRHYVPRRFGLADSARLVEETVGEAVRSGGPAPWRLVEDELTGVLIVTATPETHLEVERLFERIEATPAAERFGLRSIAVRNRSVDDLLGLLEGLLEVGALSSLAAESSAGALEPKEEPQLRDGIGGRPQGSVLAGLSISSDPGANRLIAVGEVRLLDQVERLVRDLDVRHPQVLVETLILSLSESDTHDLGVEIQKIGTSGSAAVQLASLFGLGSPDPAAGVIPPASGTGFGGVVLDPGDFSAVVRALETLNEGRTLNIPKVLVNNNEAATLTSVLQTPYVSTNASDTVATTSFGGTQDAGTTVTVTPQIAAGDRLILDYTISLSSFVGDSIDPSVPPPRQENSLQSIVTIPDGHTVVLGALDVESFTDGRSRVPILGSIPGLGALFRSDSASTTRNRFFVFLRCNVLRHDGFEDLKHLSSRELSEAGLEDDWPVLEPRVIR